MNSQFTGSINLGVLTIPIRLFSGVSDESIGFKQITPCCGATTQQRIYCRTCDREQERKLLSKGYETEPGKFVVLTADEIEAAGLPISKTIEIEACVPTGALDFRYFDKPYVVLPPEKDPGRLYGLLRAALASTGTAAIGRIVLRTRQHIAAVRVLGDFLIVQLMHWPDEVTDLAQFHAPAVEVKPAELELAEVLVRQMVGEFTPEAFTDQYRDNLSRLIEARAAGKSVEFEAPAAPASAETDVMALLAASVAAVRQRAAA